MHSTRVATLLGSVGVDVSSGDRACETCHSRTAHLHKTHHLPVTHVQAWVLDRPVYVLNLYRCCHLLDEMSLVILLLLECHLLFLDGPTECRCQAGFCDGKLSLELSHSV